MPRTFRDPHSFTREETYRTIAMTVESRQIEMTRVVDRNLAISIRADFHYWRVCLRKWIEREQERLQRADAKDFPTMESFVTAQKRFDRAFEWITAANAVACRIRPTPDPREMKLIFSPREITDTDFLKLFMPLIKEHAAGSPKEVQDFIDIWDDEDEPVSDDKEG